MPTNNYKLVDVFEIEDSITDETINLTSDEAKFKNKKCQIICKLFAGIFLCILLLYGITYLPFNYYYMKTTVVNYGVIYNSDSASFNGFIMTQALLFGKNITCSDNYDLSNNIHSEQAGLNEIQSKHKLGDIIYKYVNPIYESCLSTSSFFIVKILTSIFDIFGFLIIIIMLSFIGEIIMTKNMHELDRFVDKFI
jgi:hypothetical protein